MTADRILADTFAAHEHLAPDPDATLAEVTRRLDDRRPLAGRLAVVGAAATVVAVAAGATLLTGGDPAPATAPPAPIAVGAAPQGPGPQTITIKAGWLPTGQAGEVYTARSGRDQLRGYEVRTTSGSLSVTVQVDTRATLPTESKRGVPTDVTVAGRPARQWAVAGWAHVAVKLPGGKVATVYVDAVGRPAAELAGIARRVAGELRLDVRDRIDTDFSLGWVPARLQVSGVTHTPGSTSYALADPAASTADPSRNWVDITSSAGAWRTPIGKPRPPATAGRPVQGRPTFVYRTEAGPVLWLDEIRPDRSIQLTSADAGTTLADLYRIADGIRWTG